MELAKPTVVLAVTSGDLGGAQRHVLDLALGLRKEWTVVVLVGSSGWLTDRLAEAGVRFHIVPLDNGLGVLSNIVALQRLRALLRKLRPVIVHLHSTKMGFLGRLACRGLGPKVVFTAHGWAFGPGYRASRRFVMVRLERLAARWCEAIIVVSKADAALALQQRIGIPEQIRLVHNGVQDLPNARLAWTGEVRIGMIARLAPPKDPVTLVAAFARLGGTPASLALFGEGSLSAAALETARSLGADVRLVPPPHHRPWLEIDVAALASRAEGFPLVILEAMRDGLPVVATDVGGVREAVVDGVTGFVVPPADVEALATRLRELVADPRLRTRMGKAGRRRFEREFRAEQMVEAIEGVYRRVLRGRSPMPQSEP